MMPDADRKPGIHEQHLLRKQNNPLFGGEASAVSNDEILHARMQDDIAAQTFMQTFRHLVEEAVNLEPNAQSDTILDLKERLDRSYQQACTLPGDVSDVKNAIRRLIDLIMKSVWNGAGDDVSAQQKLREEEEARKAHFELQEIGLIAALTDEESPIAQDELVPSLLSEAEENLQVVLALFDADQLALICDDAGKYLASLDADKKHPVAWARLGLMQQRLAQLNPGQ